MFDRMSSGSQDPVRAEPRADRAWSRSVLRLAVAILLPGFAGCAHHYQPTTSGYLSDYSQLQRDSFHLNRGIGAQRAETRHATSEDYRGIDSFYIEPAAWLVDPDSRAGKNPGARGQLLARLDAELRDQLSEVKPVVDVPGPHTATIRSAITTVRLSRPLINIGLTATLWSGVPIGPFFFGGAAIEAEAIAPDGRQIAAVSTASSGGLIDAYGYYAKTGHARKALRRNVKELREALID